MRLELLASLTLALSVARAAFRLSPGAADGVYQVSVDRHWTEEQRRLDDAGTASPSVRPAARRHRGKIPSRKRAEIETSSTAAADADTTTTERSGGCNKYTTDATDSCRSPTPEATPSPTDTTTNKSIADAPSTFDWTRGIYWRTMDTEGKWECKQPHPAPLNGSDVAAAYAALDAQCDRSRGARTRVKPRHHLYSIRGGIVAFFCNFAHFSTTSDVWCDDFDRRSFEHGLVRRCGPDRPGWVTFRVGVTTLSFGLDEVDATKTFCGEGHH